MDEVAEKVKEINRKLDAADNTEGIFEESYDDLDTVAEQAQIHMKNGMFFYGKENVAFFFEVYISNGVVPLKF